MAEVTKSWESTTTQIIPCLSCNSAGVKHREELVDYHKNDYETFTKICDACNGEGRLVMMRTTVRVCVEFAKYDTHYHDFSVTRHEKLAGRTPQEIYELG